MWPKQFLNITPPAPGLFNFIRIRCTKIVILCLFLFLICFSAGGQDNEAYSFYYNPVQSNPALAGSQDMGMLRLNYRDYYPGRGLDLHSVFLSYDTFLEPVHGGVGIYISDNILGPLINELRTGAAYSYHLRATKDIYINAGFMASLINRSVKTGNIILPDQVDPLTGIISPSAETISGISKTVFDAGVGFLVSYRNYHAGFTINHLFRPYLNANNDPGSRLGRRYSVHGAAAFGSENNKFRVEPAFFLSAQEQLILLSAGASVLYNGLSINVLPFYAISYDFAFLQTGISYDTGKMEFAYNYNFNPFSSDKIRPFTISNQISVIISLNNVEKRDIIKAIKYPKL